MERWGSLEAAVEAVRRADQLGFSSVGLSEHIVNPIQSPPGNRAVSTDLWYDNFVLGGLLAAETSRIGITLSALVIPHRNPIVTAKAIATLDTVSKGRLTVIVGAGWQADEFAALGVPYAERGRLTDEYLEVMRALWTEEEPSFEGRYVSFPPVTFLPKCVQHPHVRLMIGGNSGAALRRVLRFGSGWAPMRGSVDDLRPGVEWLRENAARYGREPSELELFTRVDVLGGNLDISEARLSHGDQPPEGRTTAMRHAGTVVETLAPYAREGFGEVGLAFPWKSPSDYIETLEWLAAEVMPQLP
jgi:probable F420-dependent oxidoreductase